MGAGQDVKDAFYLALRDRVAAANPARTTVVRGTVRPAVIVAENELPGGAAGLAVNDAYSLHWAGLTSANGLLKLGCEIRYATEGTAGAGGMDRGRTLAGMDAELQQALAGGAAANATPQGTRAFWSDIAFGPAVIRGVRMERTASLEVFGYE